MAHRLRVTIVCSFAATLFANVACSPSDLVDSVPPPSSIVEPGQITTATGAVQLYNWALSRFDQTFGGGNGFCWDSFVTVTGLFTDELMRVQNAPTCTLVTDERIAAGSVIDNVVYQRYHQPRVQTRQAREALQAYAPTAPSAWQGQLYALEAYTIIWFAEVFCSGIPLSTVHLVGSPEPSAGLTTQELFERAIVLFDSAIALSGDSTRFLNLAKVGRGRALLGLGRFADAAAAVQGVPTDFAYGATFNATVGPNAVGGRPRNYQVVDAEGINGLVWSTDPRTGITTTPSLSGAMKIPAKYSRTTTGVLDATTAQNENPIPVANGVEARLIEAEAALGTGGSSWLSTLNSLRSTCIGTAPCAPVPGLTSASLPALVDPGTANARLDLLMRERAMWLFLTGHRQGDLRRLARIYHRDPNTLYPTGTYINAGFPPLIQAATTNGTSYGADLVFTPDPAEAANNSLYTGCFNLDP